MRNRLVFCIVFAVGIVLLVAVVGGAFDRRDRDVIGYNVLAERMFKGIVASEGHVIEGLVYFPLKTANIVVEVQIGPKDFVEKSGFKLHTGDMVTVIGMPIMLNDREAVLARKVSRLKGVLVVRDRFGLPLWEKDRPIFMDPERRIRLFDNGGLIN